MSSSSGSAFSKFNDVQYGRQGITCLSSSHVWFQEHLAVALLIRYNIIRVSRKCYCILLCSKLWPPHFGVQCIWQFSECLLQLPIAVTPCSEHINMFTKNKYIVFALWKISWFQKQTLAHWYEPVSFIALILILLIRRNPQGGQEPKVLRQIIYTYRHVGGKT